MSRVFASELLKLRTTRTFYGLVLSAVGLTVVLSSLGAAFSSFHGPGSTAPGEDLVGFAFFGMLLALVLGLLAVTTEFRHGTITPTLLAVPSRGRLIAAKLGAHLLAGLLLGLVAVALNLLVVGAILSLRDIPTGTSTSEALRWIAGVGVASALFAGVGVGVGALVRNQVGALVGTLAWLFVVEPLLGIVPGVDDVIAKFGIGGLSDGLDGFDSGDGTDLLGQAPAGLMLALYAVLLALAGAALLRRRDVTA